MEDPQICQFTKQGNARHHNEPFYSAKKTLFNNSRQLRDQHGCEVFVVVRRKEDHRVFTFSSDEATFTFDKVCEVVVAEATDRKHMKKNYKFKDLDVEQVDKLASVYKKTSNKRVRKDSEKSAQEKDVIADDDDVSPEHCSKTQDDH